MCSLDENSYYNLSVFFLAVALIQLNDVWVFDMSKRRWFQPFPTERQPPPRWLHGSVNIKQSMIVFGGVTNNLMLLNDVWQYQPASNSWSVLGEGTEAMDRPTPREGTVWDVLWVCLWLMFFCWRGSIVFIDNCFFYCFFFCTFRYVDGNISPENQCFGFWWHWLWVRSVQRCVAFYYGHRDLGIVGSSR